MITDVHTRFSYGIGHSDLAYADSEHYTPLSRSGCLPTTDPVVKCIMKRDVPRPDEAGALLLYPTLLHLRGLQSLVTVLRIPYRQLRFCSRRFHPH